MTNENQPPLLIEAIPKQSIAVGKHFYLDLNAYIHDSVRFETGSEEMDEELSNARLLYVVEIQNYGGLPLDIESTLTGLVSGPVLPPALEKSPYLLQVTVSNGAPESLITTFELEILPPENPEEAWRLDDRVEDELEHAGSLSAEEERALFKKLQEEARQESQTTQEKVNIWQAILEDQDIPGLPAALNRPVTHAEVYYLLERMAYFVIWNADNSAPAGPCRLLHLSGASEHFNVYNRGACIVATPRHLFDHARTLSHAVQTAQAMAREVFNRGWKVEFGGFDKMVRAAWVEFEALSKKFNKAVDYFEFTPSPQDYDALQHMRSMP